MKSKKRLIQWQKIHEKKQSQVLPDFEQESALANPDLIAEDQGFFAQFNDEHRELKLEVLREVFKTLTEKQQKILRPLAQGYKPYEVAKLLHLHPSTVNSILNQIKAKYLKIYIVRKAHTDL